MQSISIHWTFIGRHHLGRPSHNHIAVFGQRHDKHDIWQRAKKKN